MKKIMIVVLMALQWGWAQETKVATVDWKLHDDRPLMQPEYNLRCSAQALRIKEQSDLPFKVYRFGFETERWQTQQDIYSVLTTKVPTLQVSARSSLGLHPQLRGRGGAEPIIIVDGVRYDASILGFLNPNDIACITVANGVAATNFLRIDAR